MKNIYDHDMKGQIQYSSTRLFPKKIGTLLILGAILLFSAGKTMAQVVVDNTSSTSATAGTSVTLSHATGSGSDRVMLVGISTSNVAVTGVTYNGVALTSLGSQFNKNNGRGRVYIYYMIAPPNMTANVVVSYGAAVTNGTSVGVMTFTGVHQTTPFNAFAGSQGSGATPSLSIPTANSLLTFSVLATRNRNITAVGTGQTPRWQINTPTSKGAGSTKPVNSVSTTVSYTTLGNEWALAGVGIRPTALSDLQITKTANTTTPDLGGQITFSLVAKNNGPDAATNVVVNDKLPSAFTYVSHTPSGSSYSSTTGDWTIGDLANGSSTTLTITATVNCAADYKNIATVTATQPDADLGNNTSVLLIFPKNTISTTKYVCSGGTINLTQFNPCNKPSNANVTWHTSADANPSNKVNTPTAVKGSPTGTKYYVAFEDATNSCYSPTTEFTIIEYPPIVVVHTSTAVSCYGGSDGALALNVSGGTAPYTYEWTGPGGFTATTAAISGRPAGSYQVTVTDKNGCSVGPYTYNITQPAQLALTPTVTQPTCYSDGAITLAVSGGTGPYNFDWADLAGNANVQDRTGLAPGTYNVTVTDAKGCTVSSGNITITAPQNCDGVIVCSNETAAEFSVTPDPDVTGYNWTVPSGATITSGQGTPAIKVNFSGVSPGEYQVCVVAQNVCGTSETTCRPVYVNQASASAQADPVCVGGNLKLFANGGVSYYWTGPNNFTSSSPNPVIYGVTAANSGTYTVTVTTAKGCTVSTTVDVTVNPSFDITGTVTPSACGQSTGSITVTPSVGGTYTYDWSNGTTDPNLTNVPSGTYTVRVSSLTGCDVTKTFTVNDANGPTVTGTPTNISCPGSLTGAINITASGGTAPYSYYWTSGNGSGIIQGNEDQSFLSAGTYSVVVTEAGGCKGAYSVTLTQPVPLNPDFVKTDVSCFGGNNGSINVSVTGGTGSYTYSWKKDGTSFGGNTASLTGLAAGTYEVTVTDANSCTASLTIPITQPAAALSATAVPTAVKCYGGNDGQIVLTVSGGTAPYTYAWTASNGGVIPTGQAGNQNLTGLVTGSYHVTITDAKLCTYSVNNIAVSQPAAALALTGNLTHVSCFGGNNGSISLSVSGGTSGYTYVWNNGATTANLENLPAGIYTVTVTDANGS